jgi:hypothetical protein
MKQKNSRLVNFLNGLSLALAALVVTGSTLYVVSEQPWFPAGISIGNMPLPGIIRDKLSHHR